MTKKHLFKRIQSKKKTSALECFIIFLMLVGFILIVFFIGRVLYSNFTPSSDLSDHLPGDKTVAYLEWEDLKLPGNLEVSYPPNTLAELMGNLFEIDLKTALEKFGTGKISYALLESTEGKNQPLVLVEATSKNAALRYFKGLLLESEELKTSNDLNPIYSFNQGQNLHFKFVGNYVAISPEIESLESLNNNPEESLTQQESYQNTLNNLPRNPWLLGYVDIERVNFTQQVHLRQIIDPLKFTANHLSFAVRKSKNGFQFNSYLSLKEGMLALEEVNEGATFDHTLTNLVPTDNLALYLGGSDLEAEWQNTLQTLDELNPSYALILEGLLRSQSESIFGKNVDLRNDLYPLFEGEYAFAMGRNENSNHFGMILKHDDQDFATVKMEKMATGFELIAASFAPKINTVTLPDGTVSRELIPDESKVESGVSNVAGNEVACTEVRGDDRGFCYTVTQDLVIMANNKAFIEKALNPEESEMLADSSDFKKTTKDLSHVNDEMTFIQLDALKGLLPAGNIAEAIKPILSQFEASAWTKHYFENAVAIEGNLLLKTSE